MQNLVILKNPYETEGDGIINILNSYASDPMGGSKPLGAFTRQSLVAELAKRDWVVTLLAVLEGEPVGLLIAMEGLSTFASKPLMNVHDVAVLPGHRGKGIGKALFAAIEKESRERGCCKITLEVLSGNERAKRVYSDLGFHPYVLDPNLGAAQFWEKPLA